MPLGTSIMNYGIRGASALGRGWGRGVGYLGSTGMAAASGGVVGGAYGATMGRDPGQSRLGGALTGALGGAALGAGGYRYGGAALRGGLRTNAAYGRLLGRSGKTGPAPLPLRAQAFGMGAGRGAWRQLRGDALRAKRHLGASLRTNAGNMWSAMKSGYAGA